MCIQHTIAGLNRFIACWISLWKIFPILSLASVFCVFAPFFGLIFSTWLYLFRNYLMETIDKIDELKSRGKKAVYKRVHTIHIQLCTAEMLLLLLFSWDWKVGARVRERGREIKWMRAREIEFIGNFGEAKAGIIYCWNSSKFIISLPTAFCANKIRRYSFLIYQQIQDSI